VCGRGEEGRRSFLRRVAFHGGVCYILGSRVRTPAPPVNAGGGVHNKIQSGKVRTRCRG